LRRIGNRPTRQKATRTREATVSAVAFASNEIDRSFRGRKDKDGTWKSSGSFSRNEIPMAVYCLFKAFAAMVEEKDGEDGE